MMNETKRHSTFMNWGLVADLLFGLIAAAIAQKKLDRSALPIVKPTCRA